MSSLSKVRRQAVRLVVRQRLWQADGGAVLARTDDGDVKQRRWQADGGRVLARTDDGDVKGAVGQMGMPILNGSPSSRISLDMAVMWAVPVIRG